MAIQAVRGMKDILPPDSSKWQFIEATARQVLECFGFGEIRIPVLEHTELFARSIGEDTDIVSKEMYTFEDRSGDLLTMRPEATAGVVRAYLENKLYGVPGPHKLYFLGPMFRHERPQKGRLRQFHQIDVEVLDDPGPQIDAELFVLADTMLNKLGLDSVELVVNSLGCPECRPAYRQALLDYLEQHRGKLCEDCRRRMDANPLRVLDCKVDTCRQVAADAPSINQFWCDPCRGHLDTVLDLTTLAGVRFQQDPRLVRGLDYYTRTAFEFKTSKLGAQDAVGGGGRYDRLTEALGGPAKPCTGFALGMERLALIIPDEGQWQQGPQLFIAVLGEDAARWAFGAAQDLRRAGIRVETASQPASLKSQMRRANKLDAQQVLIVGGSELEQKMAQLKRMDTGEQSEVPLDSIKDHLTAPGE